MGVFGKDSILFYLFMHWFLWWTCIKTRGVVTIRQNNL